MITGSSKEAADFPGKQQKSDNNNNSINNVNKPSSSTSSSWLRLKDPRIVRVSRAFGGKDRHSKVCTVKGLRDRRVRLSVPTAIQLYDLQDRLGLSQPSKVVDWLLNAAKDEIDELPPLQMPVSFSRHQMAPQLLPVPNSQQAGAAIKIDQNADNWDQEAARSNLWTSFDAHWRGKAAKEAEVGTENEKQSSQFSKPSNSFLNSNSTAHNSMPYSSLYQWDPNNSSFPSMSHLGSSQYGSMSQLEEGVHHNMSSTLSLSSSGPTTQTYFPNSQMEMENYQRQINPFQMLSSGTNSSLNLLPTYSPALYQSMRPPFHFSMSSAAASRPPVQPRSSGGNEQNKDQDQVPSK